MSIVYFLISLISCTIGAISGIGGGIIIKPLLDGFSGLESNTISFLSGFTVLCMSLFAFLLRGKNDVKINYKISVYIALGASLGGVIGKMIFNAIMLDLALVQSLILLAINVIVYIYMKLKDRIQTKNYSNLFQCIVVGLTLGMISSFLGIGGGPINIGVLHYFFSMSPKLSAANSLFIILFSQITSLATTFATNTVPNFNMNVLILMAIGGVCGSVIGRNISKKIDNTKTQRFFSCVLIGILFINVYNVIKFL